MSIAENVAESKAIRAAVASALSLASQSIREDLNELGPEALVKAWRMMHEIVTETLNGSGQVVHEPAETVPAAMDDNEARRFEASEMTFGKHRGKQVQDVPLSYLLWIEEDEFRHDLNRYLKRPEVQREQEE